MLLQAFVHSDSGLQISLATQSCQDTEVIIPIFVFRFRLGAKAQVIYTRWRTKNRKWKIIYDDENR